MKKAYYIIMLAAMALALLFSGCALTPEAVMEVIAPSETPLPGSDLTFTGVVEATPEPMNMSYQEMDGNFCPFWADKDGDRTVAALTQLRLLSDDGRAAPAEIVTVNNDDGSTGVLITLREGLVCSDGYPLTANDLIFTYYVLLDEDYDGPYTLKTLPVRGLSAYWNGIEPDMYSKYVFLFDETYRNGKFDSELQEALDKAKSELQLQGVAESRWMNNTSYKDAYQALQNYDHERADAIRESIENAWRSDADALVDYIMTNYSTTITMGTDYTLDDIWENEGLQVMCAMRERLVGELQEDGSFVSASGKTWDMKTEFPTKDDLYEEMYALYKGDAGQYWLIEGVGRTDMITTVENEMVLQWASEDPDWHGTVDSISGIERVNDRTVAITLEYFDDAVERTLTDIYITPVHVYGNLERFDYDENSFGFTKGDLRSVRINAKVALGAGEFVYESTDFRTIYFRANDRYWLGRSGVEELILSREATASDTGTTNG